VKVIFFSISETLRFFSHEFYVIVKKKYILYIMKKKHSTKYFPGIVQDILAHQGFILDEKIQEQIEKILSQNRRYFYFVGERDEKGQKISRFIKIPANRTKKLLIPFTRQVVFARVLDSHGIIPTRSVIEACTISDVKYPFAIFETLPSESQTIGFIEEDNGSELLTSQHAQEVMSQLFALHTFPASRLSSKELSLAKVPRYKSTYPNFRRQVFWYLNKLISPQDIGDLPFYSVVEKRFGISGIKDIIYRIFETHRKVMESDEFVHPTLIHGDMAPNNLFVFDDGRVELLDLEWMGVVNHQLLALIYDYGNMRVRAWKNREFRSSLDTELFKKHPQDVAQAVFDLSILFNYGSIAGFLENYPIDKFNQAEEIRRRKVTEEDLKELLLKYN
jgi:hypothetical protein